MLRTRRNVCVRVGFRCVLTNGWGDYRAAVCLCEQQEPDSCPQKKHTPRTIQESFSPSLRWRPFVFTWLNDVIAIDRLLATCIAIDHLPPRWWSKVDEAPFHMQYGDGSMHAEGLLTLCFLSRLSVILVVLQLPASRGKYHMKISKWVECEWTKIN